LPTQTIIFLIILFLGFFSDPELQIKIAEIVLNDCYSSLTTAFNYLDKLSNAKAFFQQYIDNDQRKAIFNVFKNSKCFSKFVTGQHGLTIIFQCFNSDEEKKEILNEILKKNLICERRAWSLEELVTKFSKRKEEKEKIFLHLKKSISQPDNKKWYPIQSIQELQYFYTNYVSIQENYPKKDYLKDLLSLDEFVINRLIKQSCLELYAFFEKDNWKAISEHIIYDKTGLLSNLIKNLDDLQAILYFCSDDEKSELLIKIFENKDLCRRLIRESYPRFFDLFEKEEYHDKLLDITLEHSLYLIKDLNDLKEILDRFPSDEHKYCIREKVLQDIENDIKNARFKKLEMFFAQDENFAPSLTTGYYDKGGQKLFFQCFNDPLQHKCFLNLIVENEQLFSTIMRNEKGSNFKNTFKLIPKSPLKPALEFCIRKLWYAQELLWKKYKDLRELTNITLKLMDGFAGRVQALGNLYNAKYGVFSPVYDKKNYKGTRQINPKIIPKLILEYMAPRNNVELKEQAKLIRLPGLEKQRKLIALLTELAEMFDVESNEEKLTQLQKEHDNKKQLITLTNKIYSNEKNKKGLIKLLQHSLQLPGAFDVVDLDLNKKQLIESITKLQKKLGNEKSNQKHLIALLTNLEKELKNAGLNEKELAKLQKKLDKAKPNEAQSTTANLLTNQLTNLLTELNKAEEPEEKLLLQRYIDPRTGKIPLEKYDDLIKTIIEYHFPKPNNKDKNEVKEDEAKEAKEADEDEVKEDEKKKRPKKKNRPNLYYILSYPSPKKFDIYSESRIFKCLKRNLSTRKRTTNCSYYWYWDKMCEFFPKIANLILRKTDIIKQIESEAEPKVDTEPVKSDALNKDQLKKVLNFFQEEPYKNYKEAKEAADEAALQPNDL